VAAQKVRERVQPPCASDIVYFLCSNASLFFVLLAVQTNADALAHRLRQQLQETRAAALASAAIGTSATTAGSSGKRGKGAGDKPAAAANAAASAFSIPAVAFTQHAEPVESQSESTVMRLRLHVPLQVPMLIMMPLLSCHHCSDAPARPQCSDCGVVRRCLLPPRPPVPAGAVGLGAPQQRRYRWAVSRVDGSSTMQPPAGHAPSCSHMTCARGCMLAFGLVAARCTRHSGH